MEEHAAPAADGGPDSGDHEDDGSIFRRRVAGDQPPPKHVETWSALLLAVTVILTAWSGFQSSKWGGAMSIAFSQASSARVQASTVQGQVDSARQVDLSIYSLWLQTRALGTPKESAYVEDRFTSWFKPAFDEWVSLGGIANPESAPKSPFALASYVVPGSEEVTALNAKADAKFTQALANNQRGDNYTILGVLFATVLFFAAIATRFSNRRVEYSMLTLATVGFAVGALFLLSFPKLV
jgi:hypothetical protein